MTNATDRQGGQFILASARPRPYGTAGEDERATTRLVSQAIKLAQAGDHEALGFLYARYAENICGYVRSIVHDQHDAEDVTQHVFAKLIRVIGKYEERDVPFLAWMMRVARNVAIDHVRGQRQIPVEEVRVSEDACEGPRAVDRKINELKEALSMLPEDQREVIVLRHFAGYSPTEIARRMQRSESSVHGLHHRGRRALQAELSRRGAAPATAPRAKDVAIALLAGEPAGELSAESRAQAQEGPG